MNEPLELFTEHFPLDGHAGHRTLATRKLVLTFEHRQKARQRALLAHGREVGIQLPRGTIMRGGDLLRTADGALLEVVAAPESVSTVFSRNPQRLARVAYHLGNRHVALQIAPGCVRYLADHVLDAMVAQLGLTVVHEHAPFEPEAGAYGSHGHAHGGHAAHDTTHVGRAGGGGVAFGHLRAVHRHEP
jgi:urease accessory protein